MRFEASRISKLKGDLVNFAFQRGKIVMTPKLVIDGSRFPAADDECFAGPRISRGPTPQRPRIIPAAFGKQSLLLLQDFRHPSLRAKKYDESRGRWQARVTKDWCAVERETGWRLRLMPASRSQAISSTVSVIYACIRFAACYLGGR